MTTATAGRGSDLTYGYFGHIVKFDKLDDGTLMVYGKAAGPEVDLDEQICDPAWLKSAMPKWFEWGNVREQHSNIASGVGVEMTEGEDGGYWLKTHVVDPGTVKKVETRTLKGYSVGISNGRVVRDKAAKGGRINDGTIHEISLVDRPANAACSISIAKSADGVKFAPVQAGDEVGAAQSDVDEAPVRETAALTAIEKSATWYREALRTVEDALTGQWSHTVPFITKAARPAEDDEHADVAGAHAAIDRIADLIISEAQGLKGGNLRELRDIETLLQAARSLCYFIESELDEDDPDGLEDHEVRSYPDDEKAYVVKSASDGGGAWGEPDDEPDSDLDGDAAIAKSVSARARREAKSEGDTMPDGSYPITNQSQLESALHLAGHSKTYSKSQVMAHIRRQARKHGLSMPLHSGAPDKAAGSRAAGVPASGAATVDDATADLITKAVTAAQAESRAAHEAEIATLRADLEKALARPTHGGPVTFKHVKTATSTAPAQAPTEADPAYWTAAANAPNLAEPIRRAYLAKAASLTKGAST